MQGVKRMGQDSKSSESIWKMVMKHTGEYQTGGGGGGRAGSAAPVTL